MKIGGNSLLNSSQRASSRVSNYGINATVRPVTPLAKSASVAPVRPACYALRSADKTIGTRPDDVRS